MARRRRRREKVTFPPLSGVLREDAPREGPADDTEFELVCVDCLSDEWPGIGPGCDLAREHGAAELAGGEWRAMPAPEAVI
jgi:hypothetical protein